MKRSLIGITVAITGLVAVITGTVRADPLPGEVLKFQQLPLNNTASAPFPGHDELSTAYLTNGNVYIGTYMADDFCDHLNTPIVHVRWWGSYLNNYYGSGVLKFLIVFETDVASNAPNNSLGYSHPGAVILSQIVTKGPLAPASSTFTETPLPIGPTGPPNPDGNLFQYNAELDFPAPEFSNQVEWIKIVALTSDPLLKWGWHDRDYSIPDPFACTPPAVVPGESNISAAGPPVWHFQDDAVTGSIFVTLDGPNILVQQTNYTRTFYIPPFDGVNFSKDLAFELYTTQPPPAITVDEDAKGSTNGMSISGVLTNDPGPGGQSQALTYPLPFPGLPGDVLLLESPAGGPASDILRFNGNRTVVFYSDPFTVDTNDCPDSLADGPGPTVLYSTQVVLIETGPEGGTNGATYTPTSTQPGWDPSGPTYTFISDYAPLAADPFTAWQLKYFGCTNCVQAAGSADPDGDGMINTNEFLAGTDPTNSLSYFHITSIVRQGSGSNDINITWNARPCKVYIVQVSSGTTNDGSYVTNTFADIASSLTIGGVVGGGFVRGDVITNYVDVGGGTNKPTRYYRVRLVP
jgi:hypothetical protein